MLKNCRSHDHTSGWLKAESVHDVITFHGGRGPVRQLRTYVLSTSKVLPGSTIIFPASPFPVSDNICKLPSKRAATKMLNTSIVPRKRCDSEHKQEHAQGSCVQFESPVRDFACPLSFLMCVCVGWLADPLVVPSCIQLSSFLVLVLTSLLLFAGAFLMLMLIRMCVFLVLCLCWF